MYGGFESVAQSADCLKALALTPSSPPVTDSRHVISTLHNPFFCTTESTLFVLWFVTENHVTAGWMRSNINDYK